MEKVKTGVDNVRDWISRSAGIKLPQRGYGDEEIRGGPEDEVVAKLNRQEDLSGSDSKEHEENSSTPEAKHLGDFVNKLDPPDIRNRYSKLPLLQSQDGTFEGKEPDKWVSLPSLSSRSSGDTVVFRARIHTVRSMSAGFVFLIFREQIDTIQGVLRQREGEVSESMVRWAAHIRPGSIVLVKGKLQQAEQKVKTTSIHDIEVLVDEVHVVSERTEPIPFSVYEAEAAIEGHAIPNRVRLANRILDLRTPTSQAIFRLQSQVCHLWRQFLHSKGFLEIHTPKLQGVATEGGADVFKVDYFGRSAFLAQSPQLAKQMCISADFGRVYEIGPVFRGENSNTLRHMTEYTGLDLEMQIEWHYHEAMWLVDETLKFIFRGLYDDHIEEVERVKHHFPHENLLWLDETPVITFAEGAKMLNASGWRNDDGSQQSEYEDLSTKGERRLGELVKDKYLTDYYILDKFPASARPFYTMLDPANPELTNSFDFMVRGQEILSGGQRVHEADLLISRLEEAKIDPSTLREYVEAFQWVAPPHAGVGIGLERLLSLILDLGNIRFATLFPRDPQSFPTAAPTTPSPVLRHPKDGTVNRASGSLQPLSNLVANYGDATNTSWTDDRFLIWRDDRTGAAIAYVPLHGRAILPGNPLCAPHQLEDVITAFLHWLRSRTKLKPIFILVDKSIADVVSKSGWSSFSTAAEQRVNLANKDHLKLNGDVNRKIRHAQNESVKVVRYDSEIPSDVRQRCDDAIGEWQASRKGEQVHISNIAPWTDAAHRTYFVAEDAQQKLHCLVVLAQLAPRYGAQVKWAFDFPGATNGAIEYAVQTALQAAAEQGNATCTFGSGATSSFERAHNMGPAKAASLEQIYRAYAARFRVFEKTGFRARFNTFDDKVYICYPPKGLGLKGVRAIVDFFKH